MTASRWTTIRLDEVGDEPVRWDQEEHIPVEQIDREELLELSPVRWQGTVRRIATGGGSTGGNLGGEGFLLDARADYTQTLACQRCLKSVAEPVTAEIELLILPDDPGVGDDERELEEQELGVMVAEDDRLELPPILEEQIQLHVPMRPLCREDCPGLCPRCGADLAEGPCDCSEEPVDPRWSGLAGLKAQLAENDDSESDG